MLGPPRNKYQGGTPANMYVGSVGHLYSVPGKERKTRAVACGQLWSLLAT